MAAGRTSVGLPLSYVRKGRRTQDDAGTAVEVVHLQLQFDKLKTVPRARSYVRLVREGSHTAGSIARARSTAAGVVLVSDIELPPDSIGTWEVEARLAGDHAYLPLSARVLVHDQVPISLLLGPKPPSRIRPPRSQQGAGGAPTSPGELVVAAGRQVALNARTALVPAARRAASRAGKAADQTLARLPAPAAQRSRRLLRAGTRWVSHRRQAPG